MSGTSDATARYNCMAFANNHQRKWWEAGMHGGAYYWPPVPDTLRGWIEIFTQQGYAVTQNGRLRAQFSG
jgi:hypothetical protein